LSYGSIACDVKAVAPDEVHAAVSFPSKDSLNATTKSDDEEIVM
jgi:hypothetical protein